MNPVFLDALKLFAKILGWISLYAIMIWGCFINSVLWIQLLFLTIYVLGMCVYRSWLMNGRTFKKRNRGVN